MSRQEATDMLMAEHEAGIFLVRNSATISGDLVLCVRSVATLRSVFLSQSSFGDSGFWQTSPGVASYSVIALQIN